MNAVIRTYSGNGAKELMDVLEKNKTELESTMRSVKGFATYTLARTSDGGFSLTVCNDRAGIDESTQKAKEWIAKNAPGIGVAPPKVSEGTVIVQLK